MLLAQILLAKYHVVAGRQWLHLRGRAPGADEGPGEEPHRGGAPRQSIACFMLHIYTVND